MKVVMFSCCWNSFREVLIQLYGYFGSCSLWCCWIVPFHTYTGENLEPGDIWHFSLQNTKQLLGYQLITKCLVKKKVSLPALNWTKCQTVWQAQYQETDTFPPFPNIQSLNRGSAACKLHLNDSLRIVMTAWKKAWICNYNHTADSPVSQDF